MIYDHIMNSMSIGLDTFLYISQSGLDENKYLEYAGLPSIRPKSLSEMSYILV